MDLFQKTITLGSDLQRFSIFLGSIFSPKSAISDPNFRHYAQIMDMSPFWWMAWVEYWYFQKLEWISVILRPIPKFLHHSNGFYRVFNFWLQNEISFQLFSMPPHFSEEPLDFLGSLGNWLPESIERSVGYILVFLKKAFKNAKISDKSVKIAKSGSIKGVIRCVSITILTFLDP